MDYSNYPCYLTFLGLNIFIFITYSIEKAGFQKQLD